MNYNGDFLSTTSDALSDIRVLIERAIILENDITPIIRLRTQHQEYEARTAYDVLAAVLQTQMEILNRIYTLCRDDHNNPCGTVTMYSKAVPD